MLLTIADHLNKRSELDFFEAPMLVGEVAALGNRLDEVRALGSHSFNRRWAFQLNRLQLHLQVRDQLGALVQAVPATP
jgi:hypothetical protein